MSGVFCGVTGWAGRGIYKRVVSRLLFPPRWFSFCWPQLISHSVQGQPRGWTPQPCIGMGWEFKTMTMEVSYITRGAAEKGEREGGKVAMK